MSSKTTKTEAFGNRIFPNGLEKRSFSKSFCRFGKPVRFSKSQISAQIFIYVIAIILFSLVLLYGYNAIKGFKERSEQIAYIKFKTDLTSTVKRISSDFGTVKREEFFIGGEYSKVCFVQSYKRERDYAKIVASIDNPLIEDSVKNNVTKNVFLFTTKLQESFDVGEIDVSNRYLCIDIINGKAKIQFRGEGDHTFISKY